jgi:cardiolipin synthase
VTVANCITIGRILLTPVFGYLWWRGSHTAALIVFALAALSDLADGFAARVLNQRSKLGQVLDPAADKFMLLTSFIVAAWTRAVPVWLAVLVIGRDLVLTTGGALFVFALHKHGPEHWKPTRLGKYATFTQVLVIGLALLLRMTRYEPLRAFVGTVVIMCAVLTAISGIQYVAFGLRALGSKIPAGGNA